MGIVDRGAGRLERRYRRTGADGPFGDPRRWHGVTMEGYYWRFTDRASGRVVVALCGVNQAPDGPWATIALAAQPGGFLREAAIDRASADPHRLGVWAGDGGTAFTADERRVCVDLGHDARLDVRIDGARGWPPRPFGGLGVAHAIPALSQYWHPHVVGGRATGTATLGDTVVDLSGADVYAEKNWGAGGFPERWWWGQAHGFERPDACVAFAGGDVALGPAALVATAVVVRVGDEVARFGHPLLSPVRADVGVRHWHLRGRALGGTVDVEAEANGSAAHVLPVPVPRQRRNVSSAHQHLTGRMHVIVRRRGRVAFAGESELAGLEHGSVDSTGGT